MKFKKNIIFKGKIVCITGLHIGGSKDKLEIGGVDSPVLRDPVTRYPYIPGSTLKGKMRMLLEFLEDKVDPKGDVHKCDDANCLICSLFGSSAEDRNVGPTRLVVRDSFPDTETVKMWKEMESQLLYTEFKPENTINRLTSAANPRFIERVVPDSKFNFEIVLTIYDNDNEDNFKTKVQEGMKLLQTSGIGGSVSRGYGQIKMDLEHTIELEPADYINNSDKFKRIS
jgi:CRISPR-associated protein Csm3